MPDLYPGATWRPSSIIHPNRPETWGVVIHWTVGREAGDLSVLDGPTVDVHFYVTKQGRVYQFLDPDSQAWHAKATANRTCVGIETEGRGEPWTAPQLDAVAEVTAWLCNRYRIPIRHVDPSAGNPDTFRGIFGHKDLSVGGNRVDGNDHTDTVPDGTGWTTFLDATAAAAKPKPVAPPTLAERIDQATRLGAGSAEQVAQLVESGAVKLSEDAEELFQELRDGGFGLRSALVVVGAREALLRGWVKPPA